MHTSAATKYVQNHHSVDFTSSPKQVHIIDCFNYKVQNCLKDANRLNLPNDKLTLFGIGWQNSGVEHISTC